MRNLRMRGRLALLVVIASLPALALALYNALEQRAIAEARARDDIARLARLAAKQQAQLVEGARQTLVAASQVFHLLRNNPPACKDYFSNLLQQTRGMYHSMGLHNANGELFCNAVSWKGNINVSDRLYFRLARSSGEFSIGEYQVGRATGLSGINFGYPVKDEKGEVVAVAFTALDLRAFNTLAAETPLPDHGILTVVDIDATILARHPEADAGRVGQKLQNPPVVKAVLSGRRGVFQVTGTDGIDRLFAYETVVENPDGTRPIRVVVSIPTSVIFADANRALTRNIVGTLLAAFLVLLGAWYGAELSVLRRIRTLLATANRVRSGDLAARTGLPYGKEELGQLAQAFDEMGQALQQRDLELKQALQDVREQAITDSLTGLFNRRYLQELLPRELIRARRKGTPVAIAMADIDHFKRINDRFGHEIGDCVLKELGALLKRSIRGSDTACRYGGEEFALILPDATVEAARQRAEEIRAMVKALDLSPCGKPVGQITVSLGVAVSPYHAEEPRLLLLRADEALYQAKGTGRDRVVVSGTPDSARKETLVTSPQKPA